MLQVLWQLPLKQASPGAHSLPHVPQLSLSDRRLAQYEPASPASASHSVCDVGQLLPQSPLTQATPAPQTLPHAPQFDGSICRLVQSEPHAVCAAGQVSTVPSTRASAVMVLLPWLD